MINQLLPVVETFHSVQGEGVWLGTNAFFIRLAGCDVGCPWCDTKISWNPNRHPQRSISDLVAEAKKAAPRMVVITGGEPLMHDLTFLSAALRDQGLRVHLETSGAHPFTGKFDWVTFSPKQSKPPHADIYSHVNELKVVIKTSEDLVWAEQNAKQLSPMLDEIEQYLQPEWDTPDSREMILAYVLQHPQWRISLQVHKYLGVR
jgi:7-carboxy-7-deazaguanine synthase